MSEQPTKKQRTQPPYELLYHPAIPGRGEFIRLALEAAGASYTDVSNSDPSHSGYEVVQKICIDSDQPSSDGTNPPVFAPPALRIHAEGGEASSSSSSSSALVISQTGNVLRYLGEKLGLEGEGGEQEKWWVAQVAMTGLDLNDEVHDSHHPIASAWYYEDQKVEAGKRAGDLRGSRLPKYFGYFTRMLRWNQERGKGEGRYFVSGKLTYADTTVWQVLDGLMFAFPKEMEARKEEFPELLGTFYESIKEESGIKEYLASDRRLPYSQGVFRYYPELDRQ